MPNLEEKIQLPENPNTAKSNQPTNGNGSVSTVSLPLTHYDLFNFERALGLSSKKIGWVPKNCKHLNMMYCEEDRVPIGASYVFEKGDEKSEISITVTLRADDTYGVKNAKTVVDFVGPSRNLVIPFCEEFKNILKILVPEKYTSLSQWSHYNPKSTVVNIASLSENMFRGGNAIIKKYFGNCVKRGTFPYDIQKNVTTYRLKDINNKDEKDGDKIVVSAAQIEDKEKTFTVNEANLIVMNGTEIIWVLTVDEEKLFETKEGGNTISLKIVYSDVHKDNLKNFLSNDFESEILDAFIHSGKKFDGFLNPVRDLECVELNDIVLSETNVDLVKKSIGTFFQLQNLYKMAGFAFKRGVILHGPAGTGKTMIVKWILSTFSEVVIWVKGSEIRSAKDIDRLFNFARKAQPAVLVFEDVDFYLQSRDDGGGSIVSTMMNNLDGVESNKGILVIFTTNRLAAIESAIVDRPGRIDNKIFVGELGRGEILKLLSKKLGRFKKSYTSLDAVLDKNTGTMTGAAVVEMAQRAVTYCLNNVDLSKGVPSDIVITDVAIKKAFHEAIRNDNTKRRVGFE